MKEWCIYSQKRCNGLTGDKKLLCSSFCYEVVDTVAHQLAKMC